jgi:hypothetical protein
MTSLATAHGRFARAIRDRHLRRAEMAAREMGELSLADALAFCLLLADLDPERWSRAAARWHARFVLEAPGIGLVESALVLHALQALPERPELATNTLRSIAGTYGLSAVAAAL